MPHDHNEQAGEVVWVSTGSAGVKMRLAYVVKLRAIVIVEASSSGACKHMTRSQQVSHSMETSLTPVCNYITILVHGSLGFNLLGAHYVHTPCMTSFPARHLKPMPKNPTCPIILPVKCCKKTPDTFSVLVKYLVRSALFWRFFLGP